MNSHEATKSIKAKEQRLYKLEKQFSSNLSQSQTAIFDNMNQTPSMFADASSQNKIIEALKQEIRAEKAQLVAETLRALNELETSQNLKLNL